MISLYVRIVLFISSIFSNVERLWKAFKEFVMKIKAGKRIKNIYGYFNGIVNNLMDKLFFDHDFMN